MILVWFTLSLVLSLTDGGTNNFNRTTFPKLFNVRIVLIKVFTKVIYFDIFVFNDLMKVDTEPVDSIKINTVKRYNGWMGTL